MYKRLCYHGTYNVYQKHLGNSGIKWRKRQSRRIDEDWLMAVLILLRLDLDTLRDDLSRFYAPVKSGGRKAYAPVLYGFGQCFLW